MSKGEEGGLAPPTGAPAWADRWSMGVFLLFVASLGGAATFILSWDGKEWVLLIALVVGAALWGLEHLASRYLAGSTCGWNRWPGCLIPAAVIFLVTLAACLPVLNTYFIGDDFGYLHYFHTFSLPQLLRLFHTDMSQLVWGDPRQELRPFYGLYFMVSYQLWGLNPLGYHLSAVLLHVINVSLIFLIVKNLAPGEPWRAFLAGLLFAVSPLHTKIFYWVTGFPSEILPLFFYLAAFLCFMHFRARGSVRYLVMAVLAFAGGLSSKETAVTLPAMLVSYDLYRKVAGENGVAAAVNSPRQRPLWGLLLSYLPFVALLLVYLKLRHLSTGNYLRVDILGKIREAASSPVGFWVHLNHFVTTFWDLQTFNLRHLLLPYSGLALGIVLGLYLVWSQFVLKGGPECHKSIAPILYFGLVWYLIANIPLMIVSHFVWHLCLPAVGPCIATSFLAFPVCHEPRKWPVCVRLLGFGFLVFLSAFQLWKENTQWPPWGRLSAKMAAELRVALADVPKETLVVIWPAKSLFCLGETLPYPLQAPFGSTDPYARAHIIEDPSLYSRYPEWWEKNQLVLGAELAGPPDDPIEIDLVSWDDRNEHLRRRSRVMPRRLLSACVTEFFGVPVEKVDFLGYEEAKKLVERLARLVSESQ